MNSHKNWFKIFVILLFTFIGYWFGRHRSCDYPVLQSSFSIPQVRVSKQPTTSLQAKTAKFNREARKYAIEKCCPQTFQLSQLSQEAAKNLLSHVIVDMKNKLLYCYIPKVASSNMKRLLLALQNRTDDSNAIRYFDQRGFSFLSDFSLEDRQNMVNTYFKFLLVRNPLDRILSAYRNKFGSSNTQFHISYGRNIVRKYRNPGAPANTVKGNDVTFEEFVKYLVDKDTSMQKMNEHWMSMYELCQPCYMKYDFIGSFENLQLDIDALLVRLRAATRVTFPRKQSRYGPPLKDKEFNQFYANVTADDYKSIHRRYINDFKCFSYKFYNQIRRLG